MSKKEIEKMNPAEETVAAQAADIAPLGSRPKKEKSSIGVRIGKYAACAVVCLVLFWFGFTTVVKEGNCAVIMRFGAVREEVTEAGIYLKLPWPFESVVTYDRRLQNLEGNRLETTTKDKRNVVLQSYVVWEIVDPVLYHNSVGANGKVQAYLNDQLFSATNSVMGMYNLTGLVSLNAEEIKIDMIQQEIFQRVHDNCIQNYGINVVDVSILRLSLPDANLESVFEQMRADRESEIDTILANAGFVADKIITDAETEADGIRAEGKNEASKIDAETAKQVAQIHLDAERANTSLYQWLIQLESAVNSINGNTVLAVDAGKAPFCYLFDYAENANEDTILYDLSYLLSQLSEPQRTELIDAITALLAQSANPPATP